MLIQWRRVREARINVLRTMASCNFELKFKRAVELKLRLAIRSPELDWVHSLSACLSSLRLSANYVQDYELTRWSVSTAICAARRARPASDEIASIRAGLVKGHFLLQYGPLNARRSHWGR